ncbi:MAG: alpha-hydroxy-acid oxidizing protein [Rhizobiales bacterium]|nr:alpha-hydroxy-acid oxidizing protein [Hyphomicrobiales bacterium]
MSPPINIADLRDRARRRLPRMFFDYLDAGAFGETTLQRNRADLEALELTQQVLVDVSRRDLSHAFLGRKSALPVMLGPVGFCGMFAGRGEILAARAAKTAGIHFCLSTFAIAAMEDVAAAAGLVPDFQIYIFQRRELAEQLLERARKIGVTTLFVTADTAVGGLRERDTRNGFRTSERLGLRPLADMVLHPRWCLDQLAAGKRSLGAARDWPEFGNSLMQQTARMTRLIDPSLQWSDLKWLRDRWSGRLVIKGILSPEDARRAVDGGVDALVVSNHGGRQLDSAPSSIRVLPAIAAAVAGRIEVLFDSGIRRGSDIVKAIALGADGVLLGRAYVYGLAAAGEAGVSAALRLLAIEMDNTMALMGVSSIAELKTRGKELVGGPAGSQLI